jgi:hypothetical protein
MLNILVPTIGASMIISISSLFIIEDVRPKPEVQKVVFLNGCKKITEKLSNINLSFAPKPFRNESIKKIRPAKIQSRIMPSYTLVVIPASHREFFRKLKKKNKSRQK